MTLLHPNDWRPQGVPDLEPRAWVALREVERNTLVTAGAGAGKTEFLAQKAAFLLQTGTCRSPQRILAISFKRDAARNLQERVAKRCAPEQARRLNSFTFDAFAKGLLDRFRLAIPPPWRPHRSYRIVFPKKRDYEDFLETHNIRTVGSSQLEDGIARSTLPLAGDGGDLERAIASYWRSQFQDYGEQVPLSFAMINRLVEYLLRENPSLRRALQLTYPFVFLDEFQDTTAAQFDLLLRAFSGSRTIFTAVGDDKQRIMLWAGAMPDAFRRFEDVFAPRRVTLLSNWRSHAELVRIQHAIAVRIDPKSEHPQARAPLEVDGAVSAIWEFSDADDEAEHLAAWIRGEIERGVLSAHDIAILVRSSADTAEAALRTAFAAQGIQLRNLARMVGNGDNPISIQDLLSEELTEVLLPLLHLGATPRSPSHWSTALQHLQQLEAVELFDDLGQQKIQEALERFIRNLRGTISRTPPVTEQAEPVVTEILDFVGPERLRQSSPAYQREQDYCRVRDGFLALLKECLAGAGTWQGALDSFEGRNQVPLMTIHKSKGLEFHTMVFYGLDNQTWWSLTPTNPEELNSFFVAFTRARQRAFFTRSSRRGGPVSWLENLLEPVGVRVLDGRTILGHESGE